jgi:hypothetical protein
MYKQATNASILSLLAPTLIGSGLGAGLGGTYGLAVDAFNNYGVPVKDKKKRNQQRLSTILSGMGVGAGLGGMAGFRLGKYSPKSARPTSGGSSGGGSSGGGSSGGGSSGGGSSSSVSVDDDKPKLPPHLQAKADEGLARLKSIRDERIRAAAQPKKQLSSEERSIKWLKESLPGYKPEPRTSEKSGGLHMNIRAQILKSLIKQALDDCGCSSEDKCDKCGKEECTCKKASDKPGLWANIRAKRKRGESPAKPGDEDYPDSKNWNKLTKESSIAQLAKEAAGRCWEGYKPVKGKKPYSEDSCEPVGSKEKKADGAWTRSEGKSESGGLNAKGRASLKAQGHDIKPPVTESKPTGERASRRKSFCARMGGMKSKLTSSETANDPDSRINKALRKWSC